MLKLDYLSPVVELGFPIDYRANECSEIFSLIKAKHSFTIVGMKDIGKKNILKFIVSRDDVRKRYLGTESDNYTFVYVDINKLVSLETAELYRLMLHELVLVTGGKMSEVMGNALELFECLRRELVDYVLKTNKTVVFLFNSFQEIALLENGRIVTNLVSLRGEISYNVVFGCTTNRPLLGNEFFTDRIVWLRPFSSDVTVDIVQRNKARYGVTIPIEQEEKLAKLAAGHPGYVKYLVQNYSPDVNDWLSVSDIVIQSQRIESYLTAEELADLKKERPNRFLLDVGVQIKHGDRVEIFNPLLKLYLEARKEVVAGLTYQQDTGEILINGESAQNSLSPQEEALLTLLLAQKGNLVTREMIVEYVWDQELPSDWSIDRLVARLRKKLGDSAKSPLLIKTVRGKGLILQVE